MRRRVSPEQECGNDESTALFIYVCSILVIALKTGGGKARQHGGDATPRSPYNSPERIHFNTALRIVKMAARYITTPYVVSIGTATLPA